MSSVTQLLTLQSPAFEPNNAIPQQYTCDADNQNNPPLTISGIPEGTQSLALVMDDSNTLRGTWDHWVLWNIAPTTRQIHENSIPAEATIGMNDFGKHGYGGPCPLAGMHHYRFKLYALNTDLNLPVGARKKELERAMQGHILAKTELVATYEKAEQ